MINAELKLTIELKKLLKMAKDRLDDAYNRISDCADVHRLHDADLYYNSTCMRI